MISLTATANELPVKKIPAGYFLSENVVQGIIEKYPELEQIFQNAMKVEPGSYMSDPVTLELGNKINKIKAGESKYKEKYEVTHKALQEERKLTDKIKNTDNKIIDLKDLQIQNWKERYRKVQFQNTLEKAGLAVIVALLAVKN